MKQDILKETPDGADFEETAKPISPKKRGIRVAILLVVVGLFGFFAYSMASGNEVARTGDVAPNFQLEDLNGKNVQLSDYKGKVTVLNYFATWCVPCVDEAPELEAYSKEYGDIAPLVFINRGETKDRVKKFIKKHNTGSSTYLFDYNSKVSKLYGVVAQPETFVIDKKGVIREYIQGPVTKMELYNLVSKYE